MIFSLLLAATIVPAGQSFNCTPTAVWDGDGPIWSAEGPHIRLSGIARGKWTGRAVQGIPALRLTQSPRAINWCPCWARAAASGQLAIYQWAVRRCTAARQAALAAIEPRPSARRPARATYPARWSAMVSPRNGTDTGEDTAAHDQGPEMARASVRTQKLDADSLGRGIDYRRHYRRHQEPLRMSVTGATERQNKGSKVDPVALTLGSQRSANRRRLNGVDGSEPCVPAQ